MTREEALARLEEVIARQRSIGCEPQHIVHPFEAASKDMWSADDAVLLSYSPRIDHIDVISHLAVEVLV